MKLNAWALKTPKSKRFAIFATDFGFKKFTDLVETRGTIIHTNYYLSAYLFDWSDGKPKDSVIYPYPDVLYWNSDPPKPAASAIIRWMKEGMPGEFPYGDVAAKGWLRYFERLDNLLSEADVVVAAWKKVVALVRTPSGSAVDGSEDEESP